MLFAAMAIDFTSCSGPLLLSRAGFLCPLVYTYMCVSFDGEGADDCGGH